MDLEDSELSEKGLWTLRLWGDFLGGLDRARVSQPAEVAPVALLQQCENGSTVAFIGVVEHRLHLREHRLSTNGGLNEEGGRLAKEGVASPHKHIDALAESEQTHITSVWVELEEEAKWSHRVVPRSCALRATLRLSKLCQCLKRLVDLAPFTVGV